jgi:3-deoxy-manno-octulosonate cytidylyltransferase (CMP-KDO synthetase)
MKTIAIIPSRCGSTRLKEKPLVDILGKPMVIHVYERALRAKNLDEVLIATDSMKIKEIAESFGAKAVLTSEDHSSGTDRVSEAASLLDADVIVNVQGDEPLISPHTIDAIINPFKEKDVMMTTPITSLKEEDYSNPNVVKVVVGHKYNALYFSRSLIPYPRNTFNSSPYKHIGVYAYRQEFLSKIVQLPQTPLEKTESLEQLRVLENGYKIRCVPVREDTISVDTQEDLDRVVSFLRDQRDR